MRPSQIDENRRTFVEDLLSLSLAAVAVIVIAYINMPLLRRAVWAIAHEIGDIWMGW